MKLIAPYTMLLLALVSEVAATPTPNPNPTEPELGLVPREEKEMIIITIIDCNPNINFKDYRLLCNSPDPVNFCEAHQPAIPQTSSPPDPPRSGSVGLENPLQLGSAVIPEGCDPDAEDAGPAGILHVAVGTEMTVGIVWFPDAEHGGGSRASECTFKVKTFPGDFETFWWFNAPKGAPEINGVFEAENGFSVPDAIELICVGALANPE